MNEDCTARPRDERTEAAHANHGRLPTMDEQDWPDKPLWPGKDRWRTWD